MEAPPERRRDKGVQHCPKGPVSIVMRVVSAKPAGESGATLWWAGADGDVVR